MWHKQGTYVGTGSAWTPVNTLTFVPKVVLIKGGANIAVVRTDTMATDSAKPMTGGTALVTGCVTALNSDGFSVGTDAQTNSNGTTYYWAAWGDSGNNDLVTISYTGNGVDNTDITTPGIQPDMVWVAAEDTNSMQWTCIGNLSWTGTSQSQSNTQTFDSANIANKIQRWLTNGFQVGTNASVNTNGIIYHAVCFKEQTGVAEMHVEYAGNNADNRSLTGVGFQPDLVYTENYSGVNREGRIRFKSQVGDTAFGIGATNTAANRIQAFEADGFQIGTEANVNSSLGTGHYDGFRFKENTPLIVGVTATADADALAGTVSAVRIVNIAGAVAIAEADASYETPAIVVGVVATADADTIAGSITAQRISNISGEIATSNADALSGVVVAIIQTNITGVAATATANVIAGKIGHSANGQPATASADALAGVVTAQRIVSVVGVPATADADAITGTALIIPVASVSISGAVATANADMFVSSIYTTQSFAETNLTRSLSTTVTLHNTKTITFDVDTTVSWNATFARNFSTISFRVPRTSAAFSPLYIDEDGGFLVELNHPTLGKWKGIASVPSITSDGANIEATEIGVLTTIRTVSVNRVFTGITAGAIIRAAILDATAGLSHSFIKAGTFLEAAPHIPQYTFSGQYLSEVLADMMEMTGHEWTLTPEGSLNWGVAPTNIYPLHLVEDGDVVDAERSGNLQDVLAQVTTRGADGSSATRTGPGQGFWVKQETIEVDTTSSVTLSSEAANEISRRRDIIQEYSVMLKDKHWTIREGDTLQLVLPHSGLEGNCPTVRVLSREYRVGDNYVKLNLQYPSYVDSLNAARLINRNIKVTEAPTAAKLLEFDPCMLKSAQPLPTTLAGVTGVVVSDESGHSSATFTVTINEVTTTMDPCHEFYYVRYKRATSTSYGYIPSYELTVDIPGLALNTSYEFAVACVGKNGNISEYSGTALGVNVTTTSPRDTTPPGAVSTIIVKPGIKNLKVYWDPVADKDVAYYHLQRSGTGAGYYDKVTNSIQGVLTGGWADFGFTPLHPEPFEVHIRGTAYTDTFEGDTVETHAYRVRAVDRSGNMGPWTESDSATSISRPYIVSSGEGWLAGFTVREGGRIYFGRDGLDFLGDDILHFDVLDDESGKINFRQASDFDDEGNPIEWYEPQGLISGYANRNAATLNFASYLDEDKTTFAIVNTSVDIEAGQEAYLRVVDPDSNSIFVMGRAAGVSYASLVVDNITIFGVSTDGTPANTTWKSNSVLSGSLGTFFGRIPLEVIETP